MEKSQGTPAPTLVAGPDGQDERTKLIELIIQEVQQRLNEEEAFKLTYAKLENELKHLESEEQDLLAQTQIASAQIKAQQKLVKQVKKAVGGMK